MNDVKQKHRKDQLSKWKVNFDQYFEQGGWSNESSVIRDSTVFEHLIKDSQIGQAILESSRNSNIKKKISIFGKQKREEPKDRKSIFRRDIPTNRPSKQSKQPPIIVQLNNKNTDRLTNMKKLHYKNLEFSHLGEHREPITTRKITYEISQNKIQSGFQKCFSEKSLLNQQKIYSQHQFHQSSQAQINAAASIQQNQDQEPPSLDQEDLNSMFGDQTLKIGNQSAKNKNSKQQFYFLHPMDDLKSQMKIKSFSPQQSITSLIDKFQSKRESRVYLGVSTEEIKTETIITESNYFNQNSKRHRYYMANESNTQRDNKPMQTKFQDQKIFIATNQQSVSQQKSIIKETINSQENQNLQVSIKKKQALVDSNFYLNQKFQTTEKKQSQYFDMKSPSIESILMGRKIGQANPSFRYTVQQQTNRGSNRSTTGSMNDVDQSKLNPNNLYFNNFVSLEQVQFNQ